MKVKETSGRRGGRGDAPRRSRSFDPYNSLPTGSHVPHMSSEGVAELFRKSRQDFVSRQWEEGRKLDNTERDRDSVGFDPYNSAS